MTKGGHLQVLRAKRVARLLCRREAAVYAMCEDGTFPGAYREGREWRIPAANVEAYQLRRRAAPPAARPGRRLRPDPCPVCKKPTPLVGGRLAIHGPGPSGDPVCAGTRYTLQQAALVAERRRARTA